MKVTPREGDYVKTEGMFDEQYHAVAKIFMKAGCKSGEYYGGKVNTKYEAFGWDARDNNLYHFDIPCHGFNGRELSLSDLLGDDEVEWGGTGLPSVGSLIQFNKDYFAREDQLKVIAYDDGNLICRYTSGDRLNSLIELNIKEIQPIKSDREKAIKEMIQNMGNGKYALADFHVEFICGKLYDAGYRKIES